MVAENKKTLFCRKFQTAWIEFGIFATTNPTEAWNLALPSHLLLFSFHACVNAILPPSTLIEVKKKSFFALQLRARGNCSRKMKGLRRDALIKPAGKSTQKRRQTKTTQTEIKKEKAAKKVIEQTTFNEELHFLLGVVKNTLQVVQVHPLLESHWGRKQFRDFLHFRIATEYLDGFHLSNALAEGPITFELSVPKHMQNQRSLELSFWSRPGSLFNRECPKIFVIYIARTVSMTKLVQNSLKCWRLFPQVHALVSFYQLNSYLVEVSGARQELIIAFWNLLRILKFRTWHV